jgi:hypothetical protein
MDLSPEGRAAMTYWAQIDAAVSDKLSTADLWSAIRDAADEMGLSSPGVTIRGVSEVRGIAAGRVRASDYLARLQPGMAITDRAWSEAPWSRPLGQQSALPIFHVRYQHTTLGPDGETTTWRTSVLNGALPGTVDDLYSILDEDTAELSRKYGVDHVGYGAIQILAV